MTATTIETAWTAMTAAEREQFERDGYLLIPGALNGNEVDFYRSALDRSYVDAVASGEIAEGDALHQLSAVTSCPDLLGLIDHPSGFKYIWSILGWNVHVYHSHLDVHPTIHNQPKPWWHWHQDGGRQNREIEVSPRPRMSLKLAYWLSDVSETGRGNLTIVPRSHTVDWLPGPPKRDVEWPLPEGAMQVTARPGDGLLFDRRIWHARSNNFSEITRKVVFLGYTYRWVAVRDEVAHLSREEWFEKATPVQRQLLGHAGDGTGDHQWGHEPKTTPLYGELADRGLLDPDNPPLKP